MVSLTVAVLKIEEHMQKNEIWPLFNTAYTN